MCYHTKQLRGLKFVVCICALKFLCDIATFSLVYSLTEMMQELLSKDDTKFVLSNRFNQDTVEIFFGQQRPRGHRSDNPSVLQFLQSAQAITVQKSLALGGSSNISKKREEPIDLSSICSPLPKRCCQRKL